MLLRKHSRDRSQGELARWPHDRALREGWNYAKGRGNGSTWDGDEKQQEGSNQGRGEGSGVLILGIAPGG